MDGRIEAILTLLISPGSIFLLAKPQEEKMFDAKQSQQPKKRSRHTSANTRKCLIKSAKEKKRNSQDVCGFVLLLPVSS